MMVIGLSGKQYQLESNPFEEGGEGKIYNVLSGASGLVAKIYHTEALSLSPDLEEKLKFMMKYKPQGVIDQIAWPHDVLYYQNGRFCGFVMAMLNNNKGLEKICAYPPQYISSKQKIVIAQNICAVISKVHNSGYLFGDFHPKNIGVNKSNGRVAFFDTDTYHFRDSQNKEYRCKVGSSGFVAPELLKKADAHVAAHPNDKEPFVNMQWPTFTKETDYFALAIHIFKLLMNGFYPYDGIPSHAVASNTRSGSPNIRVKEDCYCFKPGFKPRSLAVPFLECLPLDISNLFKRAFLSGYSDPKQRPTAEEWYQALLQYENNLVSCSYNRLHQYDKKNRNCPYCEADSRDNPNRPVPNPVPLALTVPIPDVRNMTQNEAITKIRSAGLSVSVTREHHSTVQSGNVITSIPAFKSLVKQGTTVALRLSKGPDPNMVTVPDVRNMTQEAAEKEIRRAGLRFGTHYHQGEIYPSITSEHHLWVPSGNVITSSPASGSSVKQGTTVALRLSKGRDWDALWSVTFGFVGLCLIYFALFTTGTVPFSLSAVHGVMLILLSGLFFSWSEKRALLVAVTFVIIECLLVSVPLFSARVIFKDMSFFWLMVAILALGALPIIFLAGFLSGLLDKGKTLSLISGFVNCLGVIGAISFLTFFFPTRYNHALGYAYYSNGEYDRAIATYNKVIRSAKGEYDRAIANKGENIRFATNMAAALYNSRGNAYHYKGDYDSAIADYNQAIDIKPDDAMLYSNRARAYASKGDINSAIADLTQAIKLDPDNNSFKGRLAEIKQPPEKVSIPIVANKAEAKKKIPAAGLTLIVNYVYHNSIPKGNVIDSSPAFGSFVPRGTKVTLRVSSGPALLSVPNVTGMTEEGAKAAIKSAGLKAAVTHENHGSVPNDYVIASNPAHGNSVKPGGTVTLRVSSGPALLSVPNVTGMTEEGAKAAIKSAGLKAAVKRENHNSVKNGYVIGSIPAHGNSVKPGGTVTLHVSSGPALISVPNVARMTVESAKAKINSAGLEVDDVIKKEHHSSVKNGYVIGSIPAYGTLVKPGDKVTLRVVVSIWPPWGPKNPKKEVK